MLQVSILDIFTHCNINLNLTKWLKFTRKFNYMTYTNEQNTAQELCREAFLFIHEKNVWFPKMRVFFVHSFVHEKWLVHIKKLEFQQFQNFIFCKPFNLILVCVQTYFFFLNISINCVPCSNADSRFSSEMKINCDRLFYKHLYFSMYT